MDPSMVFSGSSAFKYKATEHLEAGVVGSSWFMSISTMQQYKNLSFEELRMKDYEASGGLFGSKIATLAGSLCVRSAKKLTPYQYGRQYHEIIGQVIKEHSDDNDDKTVPSAAGAERPVVNLSFLGKQNVTVLFQCSADVSFSFKRPAQEEDVPTKSKMLKGDSHKKNVFDIHQTK